MALSKVVTLFTNNFDFISRPDQNPFLPPAGKSGRVSTPIRHHWTHRRTRGEECAVKIVTFEKRPAIAPAISVRAPQHTHPRKHLIGSVSRKLDLRFLRVALTIYKSTASDGKALIISTQSRRGPTLPISLFMEAGGNNVSPRR